MSNASKIILDLCGGTGSWSKPWLDGGYDVRLITLPDLDVTKTQFGTDHHIYFYTPDGRGVVKGIDPKDVIGILAAPPCTQFSFARQRYRKPPDFPGAMQTVEACLEIIWHCQKYGRLKWWAMENPTGHLRKFLGRPPFKFYQWEYGGVFTKPTDIWGYFEKPIRLARKRPKGLSREKLMARWANPKIPNHLRESLKSTPERRAAVRAITPPGFAKAFYKANR